MTGKDEKAARLAEQLRANLRKRKAQARGQADQSAEAAVSAPPPPSRS